MPNEAMYNYVNVGQKIFRSAFDISYENIFDCAFGKGVPVMMRFALPGDIWKITNIGFFRTLPLFAPQFTGIKVKFRNFFVPLRLLDDDAEEIITGFDKNLTPVNKSFTGIEKGYNYSKYGFWDYAGVSDKITYAPSGLESAPADYWLRAYRLIYNEWYRDEHLQDEIPFAGSDDSLFDVNYSRDYFTSALLTQQLGVAPAIPLTGVLPVNYTGEQSFPYDGGFYGGHSDVILGTLVSNSPNESNTGAAAPQYSPVGVSLPYGSGITAQGDPASSVGFNVYPDIDAYYSSYNNMDLDSRLIVPRYPIDNPSSNKVKDLSIDLALSGGQFDVQDIRRAFAFQSILERNNRAGSRYNEFLRANYGISPNDETLQRPVYLGGSQSYINISEVLQQSQTTDSSPLGTLGGKGIGLSSKSCKPYLCKEFGVVMTIMSITPDTLYNSQGVNRQYTYKTRWDFFNPSLQNLGEQAIRNGELFFMSHESDDAIFGYQPMYQELRSSENQVAGSFRDTLKYWHLGREFSSRPNLNSAFITVSAGRDDLNRIFVENDEDTKPFYCHIYNKLKVIRPLVKYPIPVTL